MVPRGRHGTTHAAAAPVPALQPRGDRRGLATSIEVDVRRGVWLWRLLDLDPPPPRALARCAIDRAQRTDFTCPPVPQHGPRGVARGGGRHADRAAGRAEGTALVIAVTVVR